MHQVNRPMPGRLTAAALLAIGVAVPAGLGAQPPEQLIANGSFEQGPAVSAFLNLAAGNTSVPGWVVTGEGVDYVSKGYWVSSDGDRAIDLDGSARSATTPPHVRGGVAQTFPTTPGMRYRVDFDLAGNPNQLPRVKPLRVSAAGQSTEFAFDATGKNGRNMGWRRESWTFTALDEATTLEFLSLTVPPQTGYGAAIDNVSVIAIGAAGPVDIRENDDEIQVHLASGVLFDSGRFDLKPAATESLRAVAAVLEKHPTAPVSIEGHTDSTGTPAANLKLSENRANAVRQWLVENAGVDPGRLETRGHGDTAPVASNDTAEGRQKNRRVELRIRKSER